MRLNDLKLKTDLAFSLIHRDYHHGQHDYTLVARDGVEVVGRIDFSDFESTPHIEMISVPKRTREGIATAMLKDLQKRYPGKEIQWGMTTRQGEALRKSIKFQTVEDDETAPMFDLLAGLRVRLKELEARAQAVVAHSSRPLPEKDIEVLNALNDRARRIEYRIHGLEHALYGKSRTKNLIPEGQLTESDGGRCIRVWLHPDSGKIITVSTEEDHGATVYEWPEKFGLRQDIPDRAVEMHGDSAMDWLMVAAMKRGWVRINEKPDGFNVPLVMAASEEAARRGVVWMSGFGPLTAIQIEIMTSSSKAPSSVRISGDRLKRFLAGDVLEEGTGASRPSR
jgi:hypothetical protein